jgi:hypothetical protein
MQRDADPKCKVYLVRKLSALGFRGSPGPTQEVHFLTGLSHTRDSDAGMLACGLRGPHAPQSQSIYFVCIYVTFCGTARGHQGYCRRQPADQ